MSDNSHRICTILRVMRNRVSKAAERHEVVTSSARISTASEIIVPAVMSGAVLLLKPAIAVSNRNKGRATSNDFGNNVKTHYTGKINDRTEGEGDEGEGEGKG